MNNHPILSFQNITHFYGDKTNKLTILDKLNFDLPQGKIWALLGPSGSGKSTILQLAGLLDTPKSGTIIINQQKSNELSDNQKDIIRGQEIGFIYQFHRLLPELTAIENVMMPQLFFNKTPQQAKERAVSLLTDLGLKNRLTHFPTELSGGEQQRVAIARALANKPKLILADEPTGNLDPVTSQIVFQQLTEFVQYQGASALIATHNMDLAQKADFIFQPFQ
jgi:lipoprotein-releasing system ATP-binding protein